MATSVSFTTPETPSVESVETDGVYVYNTGHALEAANRLITLFRQQRNIDMLNATSEQIQELEDVIKALLDALDVNTATGFLLDLIGSWVGEPRFGRDDDDYRVGIQVRILVNRSSGTHEQLLEIAVRLFPLATYLVLTNPVANVQHLEVGSGLDYVQLAFAKKYFNAAREAGTAFELVYGEAAVGAVDGDPLGGTIGAVDGDPEGFEIGGSV